MVFATLLTNLLLASTALAAPSTSLEAKLKNHTAGVQTKNARSFEAPVNNVRDSGVIYVNSNWAGATHSGVRGTFTYVTGVFTIPSFPSAGASSTGVAVGIDGVTCVFSLFQTGVDITSFNGKTFYHSWYQWFPEAKKDLLGMSYNPNDIVRLSLTTSSPNSGNVTIEFD